MVSRCPVPTGVVSSATDDRREHYQAVGDGLRVVGVTGEGRPGMKCRKCRALCRSAPCSPRDGAVASYF